jgi:hypothetical protein
MFDVPKLVVLILVFGAVWIAYRWLNGLARNLPRRPPARRRVIEAEDLSACGVCGAYVAAGARPCTRADCPRPR